MTSRLLLRVAICVVIPCAITTWSSICDARCQGSDHNFHPVRHGFHLPRHDVHLFRKGVHLPSLHSSYPCSVLGHRPCIPYGTYCSIFSHSPCIPDIDYPIGQTLQLTIVSRIEDDKPDAPAERDPADRSPRDLNTIRDVFSALRACWVPPEKDAARSGTQITLRLSFNSHGGIIAEPRTTYVTTDTPPDVRQIYWNAATAALKRCTPLQFTDGLGGALAGRQFAIRFGHSDKLEFPP
jgi:hypothetical protein